MQETMAGVIASFEDVASLLRGSVALRGDSVALVTAEGETMSYTRLLDCVLRLAIDLHAATLTVPRRPRIAIVLPNGQEMAVALLAVCHTGTAVPFNPAYTAAELERYLTETAVDLVLTLKQGGGPAAVIAEKLGLPVAYLAQGAEGLVGRTDTGAMATAPGPNDLALVLLTSGSTGRSKAVPLTHRNVCCSALEVCKSIELSADDRCLSMWEQYHIGGVVDLLLAPLAAGGTIISTAGFDASQFFSLLQTMRPTWFQGVPTTLNELAGQVERRGLPPGPVSLRLIRSVAAALHPRLMADLERQFGVPVIQTYGMTEASPLITSTGLSPDRRKPGSTGRSCGTSIRIVDAKGANCGVCAEGDIAIAGSNVFTGYENDDEANAAQFRDGWFYTGDKGFLDAEGDLFVTGRTKQLINRGGEKVNPQEVDDALLALPEISEAASFAVKHPTLGEDVAAAVVLREGDIERSGDASVLGDTTSGIQGATSHPVSRPAAAKPSRKGRPTRAVVARRAVGGKRPARKGAATQRTGALSGAAVGARALRQPDRHRRRLLYARRRFPFESSRYPGTRNGTRFGHSGSRGSAGDDCANARRATRDDQLRSGPGWFREDEDWFGLNCESYAVVDALSRTK